MSRALSVATVTFIMAIVISFVSKIILGHVGLIVGFLVLLMIVATGVIFDVIGTAATAAKERPFNAMASKKVHGAKQALRMTRSADRVASFCNDIVGDMTGTISGAIGAAIALELVMRMNSGLAGETVISTVVIGLIAGLTVGGKAWGKNAAISESERIILAVGKVLAWIEDSTGFVILADQKTINKKKSSGQVKKYTEGDTNRGKTS